MLTQPEHKGAALVNGTKQADKVTPEVDVDIDSQLASWNDEAWQIAKEEAENALAANQACEIATRTLLQYAQWLRQQQKPPEKRGGLIIAKPAKKSEPSGLWTMTSSGSWVVKVAKSRVGDVRIVRKTNGTRERVELVEEVGRNEYRVVGLGKVTDESKN